MLLWIFLRTPQSCPLKSDWYESRQSGLLPPSETILDGSRFSFDACLRKPVDRTPVWFLRQAGRYMQEYRDVRKHHTLVEICKRPDIAAEVTITAAEKLGVDAAIIFADLLLPLEPMGLDFEFQAGEGPVVHHPVRTAEDVRALRTDRVQELNYVSLAIEKVAAHFKERIGIIGFCGAPFTMLASYMIEGGGLRNYIETKKIMYHDPHCVAQPAGQVGCRIDGVLSGNRCKPGQRSFRYLIAGWARCLIKRLRDVRICSVRPAGSGGASHGRCR